MKNTSTKTKTKTQAFDENTCIAKFLVSEALAVISGWYFKVYIERKDKIVPNTERYICRK